MATVESLKTINAVAEQILENSTSSMATLGESSMADLLRNGLRELASWNANIAAEYQTGDYFTGYAVSGDFYVATNSYTAYFTGTSSSSGSNITSIQIQHYPDDGQYLLAQGSFSYSGLPFITEQTYGNITYVENSWKLNNTTSITAQLIGDVTYSNGAYTGAITGVGENSINSADETWEAVLVEGNSNVSVNIFNPNLVTISSGGAVTRLLTGSMNSTGSEFIDSLDVNNVTGWSLDDPLNQLDLNSGNDTFQLTGSVGSTFNGGTGNDSFHISTPDNDIYGGDGIDIAIIGDSPDVFNFSKDGAKLIITNNIDGTRNSFSDIERIQFSDQRYALDLDGNGGIAAIAIIATFGADSLSAYMSAALSVVDSGTSLESLCDLVVDLSLIENVIGSSTNGSFVDHVYKNVVGVAPSQADHDTYTALLDNGTYTKSSLLALAANTSWVDNLLTESAVDLIGLPGNADGELLAIRYDIGLG
jgi:hypothetical protein